ncbi:MAG: hypothetical protein GF331_26340 [Chitinivibrionales bacterium]|nr:hypothetical protein [Chitinivibrionales bacterium]
MKNGERKKRRRLVAVALCISLLLHIALFLVAFMTADRYHETRRLCEVLSVELLPEQETPPAVSPVAPPVAFESMAELPEYEPPEPDFAPDFPQPALPAQTSLSSDAILEQLPPYYRVPTPQLDSQSAAEQLENARAPAYAIGRRLGFTEVDPLAKAFVVGHGRAMVGRASICFLELYGTDGGGGEFVSSSAGKSAFMDNICDYISTNTGVLVTPDAADVALAGNHWSFQSWIAGAKQHRGAQGNMSRANLFADALGSVERAVALLAAGDIPQAQSRLAWAMKACLSERYGISDTALAGEWLQAIETRADLPAWERKGIRSAHSSLLTFVQSEKPDGTELRGLYQYLRLCEIMRYPILFAFCKPEAEIDISADNSELLGTYLENGGFLYLAGARQRSFAFVETLFQRQLQGSVGEATLKRLQLSDRSLSGYAVHDPTHSIFSSRVTFSFTIPDGVPAVFTVFDSVGRQQYSRVLRDIPARGYATTSKAFTWNGTDSNGVLLPPGYYIYRFEAGLFQHTGAVVKSAIRRLRPQDLVFSSFYLLADLPGLPVFHGVAREGRLAVVIEAGSVASQATTWTPTERRPAMKWFTNVYVYALQAGGIGRSQFGTTSEGGS